MKANLKAYLVAVLARVWNFLAFIWVSLVLGFALNLISNWFTNPNRADFYSSTPISWIAGHLLLSGIFFFFLLFLTICAFLADREESRKKVVSPASYNDRMRDLTKSLDDASKNVDSVLQEMAQIIQDREKAITTLEGKQKQVQQYVESLQKGPAEPLKIFQEILEEQAKQQDKESRKLARRYFIYGSLVTLLGTAIGIAFTLPSLIGK